MSKSELFYEEESKTARPHKYSINYKEKDKFENEWIFAEKTILEKDKEIERLNNIINELEDYVCVIEYDERFYNETWQIAVRIHNKLKELKKGDTNER